MMAVTITQTYRCFEKCGTATTSASTYSTVAQWVQMEELATRKAAAYRNYLKSWQAATTATTSCTSTIHWVEEDARVANIKWKVQQMIARCDEILGDWELQANNCARLTQWPPSVTPQGRLQAIIRARQAPAIILPQGRRPLERHATEQEEYARQLLRAIVGDEQYYSFLKNGFVSLRAESGKIYQIFPGSRLTRVWSNGKKIEHLCVHYCGDTLPPTDSLIMRYLHLSNDEEGFRRTAIRHTVTEDRLQIKPVDETPLTALWKNKEGLLLPNFKVHAA